jgi:hypothetical protein
MAHVAGSGTAVTVARPTVLSKLKFEFGSIVKSICWLAARVRARSEVAATSGGLDQRWEKIGWSACLSTKDKSR